MRRDQLSAGLRGAGRALRRRLAGRQACRALVLLYHRVAEPPNDPWALAVSPANFAEQLDVLRRQARPLALGELVTRLRSGRRLPPRTIVITFDDGYADNGEIAAPALARAGVPATLFLVSGALDDAADREFWWDELERLLLTDTALPPIVRLTIGGRERAWSLGDDARQCSAATHSLGRAWRAWEDPPTPRHALYRDLWEVLRPLPTAGRERAFDSLRRLVAGAAPGGGTSPAGPRPTHRRLSAAALRELAVDGALEIGAHTVSHPALATLPPSAQRAELRESRARLEDLCGRPVRALAYPYGRPGTDYSPETMALAREAGFVCACANVAGAVDRATDPFELPRMQVQDWDGGRFEEVLAWWMKS